MPTLKKRIAVSLPPELEKALNDLRDATGVAPSSFVAEIMTQCIPMIRGVTQAALEAKSSPTNALRIMQRSMLEALSEVTNVQIELLDEQTALRLSPKPSPEPDKVAPPKKAAPKGKTRAVQQHSV